MHTLTRLAVTLALLAAVSPARAQDKNNRLLDAVNGWFTAAGLDDHYGLRPQDRPQANAAIQRLKSSPLELQLIEEGGVTQWRSMRKLKEPHQRCAIAGLMDAAFLWAHFTSVGITERPFHVYIDCGTGWVRVWLRHGPRSDGFDLMKLEVSYSIGDADIRREAPLRLRPSDIPKVEEGLRGAAFEASLLARQTYRELTETQSPVSYLMRSDAADLPTVAPSCVDDAGVFPANGKLCAARVDTQDERNLAGLALLRFLEAVHATWERGEQRDTLPGVQVIVHGEPRRWALARTVEGGKVELLVVKGYEATRKRVPVPRRFLATGPTLPVPTETASRPSPSPPFNDNRLRWYGERAPLIVFALTGDTDKAKASSPDLVGLFAHLGPAGGKDSWATCTKRRGKTPKHCELWPRVEVDAVTCTALGWALAASVPHTAKPPWTAKEEVTLALHCGLTEGHAVLELTRKPAGTNRLLISFGQYDQTPPMFAPIDPAKPF